MPVTAGLLIAHCRHFLLPVQDTPQTTSLLEREHKVRLADLETLCFRNMTCCHFKDEELIEQILFLMCYLIRAQLCLIACNIYFVVDETEVADALYSAAWRVVVTSVSKQADIFRIL